MPGIKIKDQLEVLEVFRIALSNGLIEKQEVISWADTIILKEVDPDLHIIELSLCKSANEIITTLNEIIGQPRPSVSGRVVLGFLYRNFIMGRVTLKQVVLTIDWIMIYVTLTEEEKKFMYGAYDMYDLAAGKVWGSLDAVEKNLVRFLEVYKDFSLDNFLQWKDIDQTIGEKISHLKEITESENKEWMNAWYKTKK